MRRLISLLVCLLIVACDQPVEQTTSGSGVALTERMAATPDPGFERAYSPRDFRFPADHGPHETFATEWWYFTGNLSTGARSVFRLSADPVPRRLETGHATPSTRIGAPTSCTWATLR